MDRLLDRFRAENGPGSVQIPGVYKTLDLRLDKVAKI